MLYMLQACVTGYKYNKNREYPSISIFMLPLAAIEESQ